MSHTEAAALSPETVLQQMKQNGVTDIVWLPDSETNWLYLLMQADPDLRLVGVTREGHACSIAAGLFAGGRRPMILIARTTKGYWPAAVEGALPGGTKQIVSYQSHPYSQKMNAPYFVALAESFEKHFGVTFAGSILMITAHRLNHTFCKDCACATR